MQNPQRSVTQHLLGCTGIKVSSICFSSIRVQLKLYVQLWVMQIAKVCSELSLTILKAEGIRLYWRKEKQKKISRESTKFALVTMGESIGKMKGKCSSVFGTDQSVMDGLPSISQCLGLRLHDLRQGHFQISNSVTLLMMLQEVIPAKLQTKQFSC